MKDPQIGTMRPGFEEIVSGWMLIDGMEDITDRIERAAKWTEQNGPLLPAEEATITMMIQSQLARGIQRGDFEPYISAAHKCFMAEYPPCVGKIEYRVVGVDRDQDDYYEYVCDGHLAEIEKDRLDG